MKNMKTLIGNLNQAQSAKVSLLTIAVAVIIGTILAGCASMTVVSVEKVEGPKQVRQYQDIDTKSINIIANYKDGSQKRASISQSSITFDNTKTGTQTVKVYLGNSQEATFQTEVMALQSLSVTVPSENKLVKLGSRIDFSKVKVTGQWDRMGNQEIPFSVEPRRGNMEPGPDIVKGLDSISNFDQFKAGKQTITISWKGKQTAFDVEVVAMVSMRITSNPAKLTYYQGEPLVLTGLKVTGVWPGISEEELSVSMSDITGYNAQTKGRQTVTVAKNGKTATFSVEVLDILGSLNGKWKGWEGNPLAINSEYTFNNGAFEYKHAVEGYEATEIKGTYAIANGKVTLTPVSSNKEYIKTPMEWTSYSIDIDPNNAYERIKGTVLTMVTTLWGQSTSTYRLAYVKQ